MSELKETYEKQGYLFFRDLIPREDIIQARQAILERLTELKRIKNVKDTRPINGK